MRGKNGKFITASKPKFFDGQVVTTTDRHHSKIEVVILTDPHYSESTKSWWYGNKYCALKDGEIVIGGGTSFSWREIEFEEITNLATKLAVEKYYRKNELQKLNKRIEILKEEIEKIEYAQLLTQSIK